ncbi:WD40-repeat-containing domain [Pseudocohnilembus persalinus]|uniref:WD40-repeat-containing domain n=1 Tax=Pseudocohnilembus persalinus TaxID=266149 RepID=A0A0V0QBY8_PSEPJ|nr:WD40-repeat-containing domain [Pseudocohnilembus persalinus]|eukprot:KRW99720.1 WD40-repeat-containing domain [Pseudocohnilembus persalinus]
MKNIIQYQKEYFATISNNFQELKSGSENLTINNKKFEQEINNFETEFEKNLDKTFVETKKKVMDQFKKGNKAFFDQIHQFQLGSDFLNHFIKSQQNDISKILENLDIQQKQLEKNQYQKDTSKQKEQKQLEQQIMTFLMNNNCNSYFYLFKVLQEFQKCQQKNVQQILNGTYKLEEQGQNFLEKLKQKLDETFKLQFQKEFQILESQNYQLHHDIENLKKQINIFDEKKQIFEVPKQTVQDFFLEKSENISLEKIQTQHTKFDHQDYFNPLEISVKVVQNIDDLFLFTGGWDGSVQIFDIQQNLKNVQFFEKLHKKPIKQILQLENGCVAIIGEDSVLSIMEHKKEKFELKRQIQVQIPEQIVKQIEKSCTNQEKEKKKKKIKKSQYISDEEIEQLKEKEYQDLLKGIKQNLFTISTSKEKNYLDSQKSWIILTGEQNMLYFFDMISYQMLGFKQLKNSNIISMKVVNKNLAYMGCENGDLYCVDLEKIFKSSGSEIKDETVIFKLEKAHSDWICSIQVKQIEQNKSILVTGGYDNYVKIWEVLLQKLDRDLVLQDTFNYQDQQYGDIKKINEFQCEDAVKQVELLIAKQNQQKEVQLQEYQKESSYNDVHIDSDQNGDQQQLQINEQEKKKERINSDNYEEKNNEEEYQNKDIDKTELKQLQYYLSYIAGNQFKILNQNGMVKNITLEDYDGFNNFTFFLDQEEKQKLVLAGISEKQDILIYQEKQKK